MLGCGNKIGPYDCCTIITGDAKELAKAIPDESVKLIFTDPVYDQIEDYQWLSETAVRILKQDSACLTFCSIGLLPQTMQALLSGGLAYRWRLIVRPVWAKEFHGRLCVMTQECLWYEKGTSRLLRAQFDFQYSTHKGDHVVKGSNWGKGNDCLLRWMEAFTSPTQIVFDPFCGGGNIPAARKMLGGHYLAFEIDPGIAEQAREYIQSTQPPLFVMKPEQIEMEF